MNRSFIPLLSNLAVFFLTLSSVYSQNSISPSLNASSQSLVSQSGGPTVNHATGLMSYSIPLFGQSDGGASVSIDISYVAKGIKTDQQASSVGIGWNLSATGVVTRVVKGLPDDGAKGRLLSPHPSGNTAIDNDFFRDLQKGERDGEADIFHLNYRGFQVKFLIERIVGTPIRYNAVPLDKNNALINIIVSGTGKIEGFRAVDENGNRYLFNEKEENAAHVDGVSSSYLSSTDKFTSAWYLTELETYTGEKAYFEYMPDYFSNNIKRQDNYIMVFGKKWVSYGKDPILNLEYMNLVNQYYSQYSEDYIRLLNRIGSLKSVQEEIHNKAVAVSMRMAGQSLIGEINGYIGANVFSMGGLSNVYQLEYQGYKNDLEGLNNLIKQYEVMLPPEGTFIAPNDIEHKFYELATTSTLDDTKPLQKPTISVSFVKLIKRISIKNISFDFNYYNPTSPNTPHTLLSNIVKRDDSGNTLQEVVFDYTTFNRTNTSNGGRPFLDSVTKKVAANKEGKDLVFQFDYYDKTLDITAECKDYWGFYNGVSANYGNFPEEFCVADLLNNYTVIEVLDKIHNFEACFGSDFLGAFAELDSTETRSFDPVEDKTIVHSLKKIILPSGGAYEFTYENNRINLNLDVGSLHSKQFAGIRIKEIIATDNGQESSKRIFHYDFVRKNGTTVESAGNYLKRGYQSFVLDLQYDNYYTPEDKLLSSKLFDASYQVADGGNENVHYNYVEEETVGWGRIGYHYLPFLPNGSYPYVNGSYPYWLEGLLLGKFFYDNQGRLKHAEKYKYQADILDVQPYLDDHDYLSRFVSVNSHSYSNVISQFKPSPFETGYDTNPSNYPNTFHPKTYFNAYTMLYTPNILPRTNPVIKTLEYNIKSGGNILLKETESLILPDNGQLPDLNSDETIYNFRWLYNTAYQGAVKEIQTFSYENNQHRWPTQISYEDANGDNHVRKIKRPLDYLAGTADYIDSLRSHNNIGGPIEVFSWAKLNGDTEWKLLDAEGSIYSRILLSAQDGHTERWVMVPEKKYVTSLATPIIPTAQAWSETFNSIPPYNVTNYNQTGGYETREHYYWKTGFQGVASAGVSGIGPTDKIASIRGYEEELEVSGADGDEILVIPNLARVDVKKPATHWTHLIDGSYGGYDLFLAGLQERIRKVLAPILDPMIFESPYSTLMKIDSVITVIDRKVAPNLVDERLNSMMDEIVLLYTDGVNDGNYNFNSLCAPHTSFEEIFQIFFILHSHFSGLEEADNTFSRPIKKTIFNVDGKLTFTLGLDKYLVSGNKMQVYVSPVPYFTNAMNVSVRFTYTDQTPAYTQVLSTASMANGFGVVSLDLMTLPNANKLKTMQIDAPNYPARSFFVIPEGRPFNFKRFNVEGQLVEERNSRGDLQTYGYDGQGRLIWTKDRDGNVLNHVEYNLGTN